VDTSIVISYILCDSMMSFLFIKKKEGMMPFGVIVINYFDGSFWSYSNFGYPNIDLGQTLTS